jgi:alkylation response protein AidB-like acyl-CoA dehydrogenase
VDFAFNEDQELLRETTRRFLDQRHPLAALRPLLEADDVVDRDIWREGAALGWTSMLVPAEHDGGSVSAQPLVDLVVIAEELGRVLYPGPNVATNVVADAVATFGHDEMRADVLPKIVAGDMLGAWCLSGDGRVERDAVEVVAEIDEERGVRLDGSARYVVGASAADVLLVTARAGTTPVHVLVPAWLPGVSIHAHAGLDLTRRLAEVRFDGARVRGSALVGSPGDQAEALTARALGLATVLQAAEAVGAADHLFQRTVQYAKDRVQFDRPIGSFQAIKHRLADLHVTLEGMRAATHYAALAFGDELPDAAEAVAVAGSYVGDAYAHLCGEALQLHGGIGFTWEHDVHLFVRRAKVDQVLHGDPAWHREQLCRLVEATALAGVD